MALEGLGEQKPNKSTGDNQDESWLPDKGNCSIETQTHFGIMLLKCVGNAAFRSSGFVYFTYCIICLSSHLNVILSSLS